MKYFYDTEFIEDGLTIDLVSIGIVSEDDRKLYLVSNEYNKKKADTWVRKNVLSQIKETDAKFSNREIARQIVEFVGDDMDVELWAYYADYDHVVLCQLFGRMINLPKNFPMYTMDIKQLCNSVGNPKLPKPDKLLHNALHDAEWNKSTYEFLTK